MLTFLFVLACFFASFVAWINRSRVWTSLHTITFLQCLLYTAWFLYVGVILHYLSDVVQTINLLPWVLALVVITMNMADHGLLHSISNFSKHAPAPAPVSNNDGLIASLKDLAECIKKLQQDEAQSKLDKVHLKQQLAHHAHRIQNLESNSVDLPNENVSDSPFVPPSADALNNYKAGKAKYLGTESSRYFMNPRRLQAFQETVTPATVTPVVEDLAPASSSPASSIVAKMPLADEKTTQETATLATVTPVVKDLASASSSSASSVAEKLTSTAEKATQETTAPPAVIPSVMHVAPVTPSSPSVVTPEKLSPVAETTQQSPQTTEKSTKESETSSTTPVVQSRKQSSRNRRAAFEKSKAPSHAQTSTKVKGSDRIVKPVDTSSRRSERRQRTLDSAVSTSPSSPFSKWEFSPSGNAYHNLLNTVIPSPAAAEEAAPVVAARPQSPISAPDVAAVSGPLPSSATLERETVDLDAVATPLPVSRPPTPVVAIDDAVLTPLPLTRPTSPVAGDNDNLATPKPLSQPTRPVASGNDAVVVNMPAAPPAYALSLEETLSDFKRPSVHTKAALTDEQLAAICEGLGTSTHEQGEEMEVDTAVEGNPFLKGWAWKSTRRQSPEGAAGSSGTGEHQPIVEGRKDEEMKDAEEEHVPPPQHSGTTPRPSTASMFENRPFPVAVPFPQQRTWINPGFPAPNPFGSHLEAQSSAAKEQDDIDMGDDLDHENPSKGSDKMQDDLPFPKKDAPAGDVDHDGDEDMDGRGGEKLLAGGSSQQQQVVSGPGFNVQNFEAPPGYRPVTSMVQTSMFPSQRVTEEAHQRPSFSEALSPANIQALMEYNNAQNIPVPPATAPSMDNSSAASVAAPAMLTSSELVSTQTYQASTAASTADANIDPALLALSAGDEHVDNPASYAVDDIYGDEGSAPTTTSPSAPRAQPAQTLLAASTQLQQAALATPVEAEDFDSDVDDLKPTAKGTEGQHPGGDDQNTLAQSSTKRDPEFGDPEYEDWFAAQLSGESVEPGTQDTSSGANAQGTASAPDAEMDDGASTASSEAKTEVGDWREGYGGPASVYYPQEESRAELPEEGLFAPRPDANEYEEWKKDAEAKCAADRAREEAERNNTASSASTSEAPYVSPVASAPRTRPVLGPTGQRVVLPPPRRRRNLDAAASPVRFTFGQNAPVPTTPAQNAPVQPSEGLQTGPVQNTPAPDVVMDDENRAGVNPDLFYPPVQNTVNNPATQSAPSADVAMTNDSSSSSEESTSNNSPARPATGQSGAEFQQNAQNYGSFQAALMMYGSPTPGTVRTPPSTQQGAPSSSTAAPPQGSPPPPAASPPRLQGQVSSAGSPSPRYNPRGQGPPPGSSSLQPPNNNAASGSKPKLSPTDPKTYGKPWPHPDTESRHVMIPMEPTIREDFITKDVRGIPDDFDSDNWKAMRRVPDRLRTFFEPPQVGLSGARDWYFERLVVLLKYIELEWQTESYAATATVPTSLYTAVIEALEEVLKQWDNADATNLAGYAQERRDNMEAFFKVLAWFDGPLVARMRRLSEKKSNRHAAALIEAARTFKKKAKAHKDGQDAPKDKNAKKQDEDDTDMS